MGLWCERSVHMGLNSIEPNKVEEVKMAVEEFGEVEVSWSCTGRTLHYTLALQLADMLPEYEFEIDYDHYKCICRKRVD